MNPAQFIREGFVEIREHLGRTVLQTLGVILGVASVVATLGMTASMDARRDQYFRESGGTRLMGVYNQPPGELEMTARQRAKTGLKLTTPRRSGTPSTVSTWWWPRSPAATGCAPARPRRASGSPPSSPSSCRCASSRWAAVATSPITTWRPQRRWSCSGSTRARELFGTADPVGKARQHRRQGLHRGRRHGREDLLLAGVGHATTPTSGSTG